MIHRIKEKVKQNSRWKALALRLLFRPAPYKTRVRWYVHLWLIFPRYFRRGISWRSRLDLVPFHSFRLGRQSRIEMNTVVNNGMGDVVLDDQVETGVGCVLIGPLHLHRHVGLSQYVRILGMHHGTDPTVPHHFAPVQKAPVILEEDVFVGTGTVIMGKKNGEPLVLGRYCRIGANSVVLDDIPPYSVAVGNPARVVRVWDHTLGKWVKPSTLDSTDISQSYETTISRY